MPEPTGDILPDEILDKHLGGGSSTATAPNPAEESDVTPDDLDDTDLESTDEEDDRDTDDLDDEGEEESDDTLDEDEDLDEDDEDWDDEEEDEDLDDLDEEDDLDDDEEEDEPGTAGGTRSKPKKGEEATDDVLETVTAEERERIEKDPVLKKLHRHMQADYTRKTQSAARKMREAEAIRDKYDTFVEKVQSPEGAVAFVKDIVLQDQTIAAAAFESIATGEDAKEFLVEVGLEMPDVFLEAFDRVQELNEDEDQKARHVKERDREREDAEYERRQQGRRREHFRGRVKAIREQAEKLATRAGIGDFTDDIIDAVDAEIARRGKAGEDWDLSRDEVKGIVKRVRKDLRSKEERIRAKLDRERAAQDRKRTKDRARNSKKKRRPPRTSSGAGSGKNTKFEPPPNKDPLDAYVDERLSD